MKNHNYDWHRVHTQKRYLERFNTDLSDDEYNKLCLLAIKEDAIKLTKHKYRRVIIFKEQYIWCTFNRFQSIITLFPLSKKEILAYNSNRIYYPKLTLIYEKINERKKILKEAKKHASPGEPSHLS